MDHRCPNIVQRSVVTSCTPRAAAMSMPMICRPCWRAQSPPSAPSGKRPTSGRMRSSWLARQWWSEDRTQSPQLRRPTVISSVRTWLTARCVAWPQQMGGCWPAQAPARLFASGRPRLPTHLRFPRRLMVLPIRTTTSHQRPEQWRDKSSKIRESRPAIACSSALATGV